MKCFVGILFTCAGLSAGADTASQGMSSDITRMLRETVLREDLPGITAAITSSKGVLALGSAGLRQLNSEVPLTTGDRLHLGSCTKAMSALVIARLVMNKQLRWETSLIEVLPELKGVIAAEFHSITLWELLTHRSGVPANARDWWAYGEMPLMQRRLAQVKENLSFPAVQERGTYHYSNLGYMIAGCIAERVTGKAWEALMTDLLFGPLGMKSAGFGPPGTRETIREPWGHARIEGRWSAGQFDNAPALGPAGRVHCSISDWARFLSCYLPEGPSMGLDETTRRKMVSPEGNYAGGWIIDRRAWAKGIVLTHSGSNTMWFAVVWVAPALDRAFAVVTNSHDKVSRNICDRVVGRLIKINQGSR